MNRKLFWLFTAILLVSIHRAEAQQPKKLIRIAYLVAGSASSSNSTRDAFRQGLRDLGYIEGKNLKIEHRYADGIESRLPELAAELVQLSPDIMFTANSAAALALKNATTTIPIVLVLTADPVAIGLVQSLARPGENITGLTRLSNSPDISGKRLELLKEAFPGVKLVAVLRNPNSPAAAAVFREIGFVAQGLRVEVQPIEIRAPTDFESAFSTITKIRADSLMVLSGANMNIGEPVIVKFAATRRVPAMYFRPETVDIGGLMYYGPNETDLFFRAAHHVDKILKGVKPADLPFEQPTKFYLAINLKTAKEIGVTIPPNVLARADRVIR